MATTEIPRESENAVRESNKSWRLIAKNQMRRTSKWLLFMLYRTGIKSCGEIQNCRTELDLLHTDFVDYLKYEYNDSNKATNKLNIAIQMLEEAESALERFDTISFWRYYSLSRMWELHAARDIDKEQNNEPNSSFLQERLEDILVEATRVLNPKQLEEVKILFGEEKRSIEDVENGIQKVYDQFIENTQQFLQKRVITIQFEFFILTTIISLSLIHYIISLKGAENLLSQAPLDSATISPTILLAAISVFGILGASVSSLLSLSSVLSDGIHISEHVGDLRLAFGRIMLGWAGAMILYIFLLSGLQTVLVLTYGGVLMMSFAAGFSERLLLNAVKSISGEVDGNDTDRPVR